MVQYNRVKKVDITFYAVFCYLQNAKKPYK